MRETQGDTDGERMDPLPAPRESMEQLTGTIGSVEIEVRTFARNQYGLSCSYSRNPDGQVSVQGWVVGWDTAPVDSSYMKEFALLRGCLIVGQIRHTFREWGMPYPSVGHLRAGDDATRSRLRHWLNEGRANLYPPPGQRSP